MKRVLLTLFTLLNAILSFAQTELLKNGGFETWNGDVPAEWCSQSWSNAAVSASTTARSGSKAAQLVNTSKDGNQRIASDVLNLKAGTYTYTVYARALEGEAAVRLGYVPATKQADGSYKTGSYSWGYNQNKVNGPDTISTEWFKQTYTFTLKETTQLSLCVMHSRNYISSTILLDDASLTTTDGGISTEEIGGETDVDFNPIVSGTCGDNVTYTLNTETGVLKIEGTGAMSDYDVIVLLYDRREVYITSAPWQNYYQTLTSVNISQGVTSIGNSAFSGCSSLTSLTIPEGVTSIGDYAFSGCSSLTSITIPEGVTSIAYRTFQLCSSLTSITIPSSVASIGERAFYGCSSLTNVTIPNSVTIIVDRAFSGCI